MNICHISDTHGKHQEIDWTGIDMSLIDVIVHSGDFTNYGRLDDVTDFFEWYSKLPIKHKILIAGNHDRSLDVKYSTEYGGVKGTLPSSISTLLNDHKDSFHYLLNSYVTIDGVKFWGSPFTTWFNGDRWAFNRYEWSMNDIFSTVPNDVNVIVTHGPPSRILDRTLRGDYVGCEELLNKVTKLRDLKLVCFGHIHEAVGTLTIEDVIYSNGSIVNFYHDIQIQPKLITI